MGRLTIVPKVRDIPKQRSNKCLSGCSWPSLWQVLWRYDRDIQGLHPHGPFIGSAHFWEARMGLLCHIVHLNVMMLMILMSRSIHMCMTCFQTPGVACRRSRCHITTPCFKYHQQSCLADSNSFLKNLWNNHAAIALLCVIIGDHLDGCSIPSTIFISNACADCGAHKNIALVLCGPRNLDSREGGQLMHRTSVSVMCEL